MDPIVYIEHNYVYNLPETSRAGEGRAERAGSSKEKGELGKNNTISSLIYPTVPM